MYSHQDRVIVRVETKDGPREAKGRVVIKLRHSVLVRIDGDEKYLHPFQNDKVRPLEE